MENQDLKEKMEILKELNTDDSRYLYRVCKAFEKYREKMKKMREKVYIEISNQKSDVKNGIINLDDIDCEKYFNTRMKQNINRMTSEIMELPKEKFFANKHICKEIIYNNKLKNTTSDSNEKIDIAELINVLDKNKITDLKIVAKNVNDENIFKYCELTKSIEIIKREDIMERNEMIYTYICEYLNKDFISNQYCDFIDNKCVAQRHFNFYPITSEDGCCFKQIKKCEHLNKGLCEVECMACKLFACPYLTKRGVGYWANEFVLLNAFFDKKQRKHLVFDFYKSKEEILLKILKK